MRACFLAVALLFALAATAQAQSPPSAPQPLQPGDAFGEEVTLPERTIVFVTGEAKWEAAFETLAEAFRTLDDYLARQAITPNGPAMTIFTETSDAGFKFRAARPVAEPPKIPPKGDIAVGQAPSGKALKFVHRGSYDAMDATYEAITNDLDDKGLEAKDIFIEQYAQDPSKASPEKLVVEIYVPVK